MPSALATAALWPFGVTLTAWHYMWRTTPFHRREQAGSPDDDAMPALPDGVSLADVQLPEDGTGALFHRRYQARIRDARLRPEELMAEVQADPDRLSPSEFARFTKLRGDEGRMAVGDEYLVRMPGPWNGPVRVVATSPTSFRFVTLEGHLEAGQIEFRVTTTDDGNADHLLFTIESWAASGDRLSKLLYQHLRMSKEVQLHMWTSVIERAARHCEGRLTGGIDIDTRRLGE